MKAKCSQSPSFSFRALAFVSAGLLLPSFSDVRTSALRRIQFACIYSAIWDLLSFIILTPSIIMVDLFIFLPYNQLIQNFLRVVKCKMKKALIILVCFSILASLFACTHEAEENPASDFEYEFSPSNESALITKYIEKRRYSLQDRRPYRYSPNKCFGKFGKRRYAGRISKYGC